MIKTLTEEEQGGGGPHIISTEGLDACVAEVVRLRIKHTQLTAEMEAEVAQIQKRFANRLANLKEEIAAREDSVAVYCGSHRGELFPERKSRETPHAVIGFRLRPPSVALARKVKWSDVVARLLRLPWGKAYLRTAEPKPDKEALLADREKLTREQLVSAGIEFVQDEEFFIDPKPETARDA